MAKSNTPEQEEAFGAAPQFANGGNGGEIVCAVLGVIVVLAAGALWRRKRLAHVEAA